MASRNPIFLSGEDAGPFRSNIDVRSYSMLLPDGRLIQIGFLNWTNAVHWGFPNILFAVDVNGRFKKPNQLGRDIFFIAMDKQQYYGPELYVIQPIIRKYNGHNFMENTCKPDSTGYSCSENIIRDQAMKY